MLSWLAFEAHRGLDHELGARRCQPLGQLFPGIHIQHQSEMRDRDVVPVDGVAGSIPRFARKVRHDLVAVEIEVDPFIRASPFSAAYNFAIVSCQKDLECR